MSLHEAELERRSCAFRRQARKRRSITTSDVENVRLPEVVALALSESLDLHGISSDASICNMFDVSYIDEGITIILTTLFIWLKSWNTQ
uniref:Uncharacterized protein n=1 Tax=Angiostrongylus cantonensis TaxID=6313 RepID=A0A158PBV9_ANGCA